MRVAPTFTRISLDRSKTRILKGVPAPAALPTEPLPVQTTTSETSVVQYTNFEGIKKEFTIITGVIDDKGDYVRVRVSPTFKYITLKRTRIGNPEASDAEIRLAARTAGADEFIARLPQGYQTPLGRGGGKLSGGQKQRLSIARALVRKAKILILDEPTSALDPETERRLVESLREASRDRVVFVVAHRLSTIRSADQILFVDEGRIVERGTHEELMARPDGAYRSISRSPTQSKHWMTHDSWQTF